MQNREYIEQIWSLAYAAFVQDHAQAVLPAFAAKGAINELQFRMMRSIAALRTASATDMGKHKDAITGDALAANAAGWMSDEVCHRILDLLQQVR